MNRLIFLFTTISILHVPGCVDNQPSEVETPLQPRVTSADSATERVKQEGRTLKRDEEVQTVSERWKSQRKVQDFLWLGEHAIPKGASQADVRQVLGEPLRAGHKGQFITGGFAWYYVPFDKKKGPCTSYGILFNKDGTVEGVCHKDIE